MTSSTTYTCCPNGYQPLAAIVNENSAEDDKCKEKIGIQTSSGLKKSCRLAIYTQNSLSSKWLYIVSSMLLYMISDPSLDQAIKVLLHGL